jgi:hypothetical protein
MTRLHSALAISLACLVVGPVAAQDTAADLELKGFRIGMPSADAKANSPAATCEVLGPGLERCTDEAASLNERKARLEFFLMDDKLLMASYQRIQTGHAQDIGTVLGEKFGPPTQQWTESKWHLGSNRNVRLQKSIWDRNGAQLQVLPFALEDTRERNTFSSVRLVHAPTWDAQWIPRFRAAEADKRNPKRSLSRSDI